MYSRKDLMCNRIIAYHLKRLACAVPEIDLDAPIKKWDELAKMYKVSHYC